MNDENEQIKPEEEAENLPQKNTGAAYTESTSRRQVLMRLGTIAVILATENAIARAVPTEVGGGTIGDGTCGKKVGQTTYFSPDEDCGTGTPVKQDADCGKLASNAGSTGPYQTHGDGDCSSQTGLVGENADADCGKPETANGGAHQDSDCGKAGIEVKNQDGDCGLQGGLGQSPHTDQDCGQAADEGSYNTDNDCTGPSSNDDSDCNTRIDASYKNVDGFEHSIYDPIPPTP